jgi:heme/copper-type cytochrome/quinol oxidase subunit 4
MSSVDIGEVIFLIVVVVVGLGGMLWVVKNENK